MAGIPSGMFTEQELNKLNNDPMTRAQTKGMWEKIPGVSTIKGYMNQFTGDDVTKDFNALMQNSQSAIIREFIEHYLVGMTSEQRRIYEDKLYPLLYAYVKNKTEKEEAEKHYYKMYSIKMRILVDFILRSIIVGMIEAPISDLYNYLIKKFRIYFFLNGMEENTYEFLSNIYIRKIEELNLDGDKYTEIMAFLQQITEFVVTGNKIHVTNLILEGVSGTGKTSIGLAMISKVLETYKSSHQFKTWKNTYRGLIPKFFRRLFFMRRYEHLRIIYTSGSMLNEYKEDEAQVVLEKMWQDLLDHIRNRPDHVFMVFIDEGEIFLRHQFSTIMKKFLTDLDKINNSNISDSNTPLHGMGIIILATNHANANDVDGNLSRRLFSINFATPGIHSRAEVFMMYLTEYARKNIYKNVYISEYLKLSAEKLIQFTDNFSQSDIENIVFLLFVQSVTYGTPITILNALYVIRMEYIKRKVLVEHKKNKDIDNQKLSMLITDIEEYIANLWNMLYKNKEKSHQIKNLLHKDVLKLEIKHVNKT